MAVTVPDWADTLLDLVGVNWPNVDEDAYREMADALREFADDLSDDGQLANNHMERLLSSGQGEAMDALERHWTKVKGKHLKDVVSAARTIAGALDLAAGAIEAMKWKAVAELGILAGQTGLAMALIPVTGGLSALLGAGAIALTKKQLLKLITGAMEEAVGHIVAVMTEPAVAALENMAADLVVQVGMDALGVQEGVDLNRTGQAGKEGFDQGVQGAKEGLNLASAGGGGSGGGDGKGVHIEHDEHDRAGTKLNGVSVGIRGKTAGRLTKARTAQGRNKGRDDIADALDPVIEKAMGALVKSARTMGDHIGEALPKAVKQISKDHRNNDDDIRDRFARTHKNGDGNGNGGGSGGPRQRGKSGDDAHTRPNSAGDAKNDPRANSVSLEKTVCKNDPVDVATGKMLLPQTDLVLPGVLPLALRRIHVSTYRYGHWFGPSWASTLDERIEVDAFGGGAVWAREDGSLLVYPSLPRPDGEQVLPLEGDRLPLVHAGADDYGTTYEVRDPHGGPVRSFTGNPYRASTAYWLSAIEDRNGNRVDFARRADGAPTAVTHSGGYVVQITATDTRVTDLAVRGSDGPTTAVGYGYDRTGRLVTLTGPDGTDGPAMRFTYDGDGRVTSWTDRNGSVFRYVYDAEGRVAGTVGPEGVLSSTFTYDVHPETGHRTTRYTDSTGATTVLHLNDRLQVVAETDPLGRTTHLTWDAYDRPLTRTDALGHTTELTWSERGNLVGVRLPDGTTATARYDERNLPVEITGTDGTTWRQAFDGSGNCISVQAPDGTVKRFTHDRTGALATMTDALGGAVHLTSDAAGLPLEVGDEHGVTRVRRDHRGRPLRIVDPAGRAQEFVWDDDDRLLARTTADGARESWVWDAEGNCTAYTDAAGGVWGTTYGAFDKPLLRIDPDGARHRLRYDTELRLVEVTDPLGQSWSYTYDAVGNMIAETDFEGRTSHYGYDAANRITRRVNPAGQTVTYTWDAMGRLVSDDADGDLTRYAYDAAGALVEARTATSALSIVRDVMGRPLSETIDGRTLRYGYDPAGRRTARTTPTGAVTDLTYDPAGRRCSLAVDGHTLTFGHDLLGREVSRVWGDPAAPVTLTTTWDDADRPTSRSLAAGTAPAPLVRRDYSYRADGFPLTIGEQTATTERHIKHISLDPMGRPLTVADGSWTEQYAYDRAGNQDVAQWPTRAGRDEARGPRSYAGTRLVTAGALRYAHDAAGRVVERRRARPSRKPDLWRYTYDARDRLTSCTTPDGTLWTYAYDPLGRRAAKHRMAADGRSPVQTVRYTWDGTVLAEQVDESTSTALTWEYEGHRPLVQYERRLLDDAGTDARFFAIVTDLVGTPTELVSSTGETAWRSRSTTWGTTGWNRDATAYTPLRFPGQYADPETGLHYNFHRHYDPDTARYTTLDPLGLAPAPNPATYVANPWASTDPLGLAPKRCSFDAYDWGDATSGFGGSVRYGRLDHLGRPTGVHAAIRPEMLDKGTEAGSLRTPGWRGNGNDFNEARGHLYANRLGGHGKGRFAWQNLVTETQTPTNTPEQRVSVEAVIYNQVKNNDEIVQYNVVPKYAGTNPIPHEIHFTAYGSKGFTFTYILENPAAYVRTGV
ncbi:type IV secretion protein Rhs [Streptomyces sp. SID2131]|nr:type IV secretion protein Rhs [Streptomyces sp. SID2131]